MKVKSKKSPKKIKVKVCKCGVFLCHCNKNNKKPPKYHKLIDHELKSIESLMTEIQRKIDNLYQVCNRLYEESTNEQ